MTSIHFAWPSTAFTSVLELFTLASLCLPGLLFSLHSTYYPLDFFLWLDPHVQVFNPR